MHEQDVLQNGQQRTIALLSAAVRATMLSSECQKVTVEALDLSVRGFAAEMTAESLMNQLDDVAVGLDTLKGREDSLNGLSELDSLRLQMAMDRLSKMTSALSNILKKISDTATTITQNLK